MRILTFIAAVALGSVGAHATEIKQILTKNSSGNAGFVINSGGWDENNSAHADDVYRAFKKQKGAEPGAFDFYYQLIAARQYQPNKGWCSTNLDFGTFLQGIFGISQGAFAALKLNLGYVYDGGQKVAFFGTDSPILMVGHGQAAGAATPGTGCFFQITPAFQTPLYRYSGGGRDEDVFTFDFGVVGGRATNLNAVSIVFGLFDKFNAAYNIATLKAGQESAIQAAANSFQAAVQNALTAAGSTAANYSMQVSNKFYQRVAVAIPDLFGQRAPTGNLVLYVRRSASILLDTRQTTITPSAILLSDRIALRQCGIDATVKGTCAAAKSLRAALFDAAKTIVDKPSIDIYDLKTQQTRANILNLCKVVRDTLRETFRLSVIDEMLVRWALVKQSGLYDTLFDATKLAALAKETNDDPNSYSGACYNKSDNTVLDAVLGDSRVNVKRDDGTVQP